MLYLQHFVTINNAEAVDGMNLSDEVRFLKGVGPKKSQLLLRLGICNIYDVLTYFPRAYEDRSTVCQIAGLQAGEKAVIAGVITNVTEKRTARGMSILTALVSDGTGYLDITWFNQKFLKTKLKPGIKVFATGKIAYAYGGMGKLAMTQVASYQLLQPDEDAQECQGILSVYAATEQLKQNFLRGLVRQVLSADLKIEEIIPEAVRRRYHLLSREEALRKIHFPDSLADLAEARKRLAFEELYLIQSGLLYLKQQVRQQKRGIRHLESSALVRDVMAGLPYQLTADQSKVWQEICHDMQSVFPMRRLVQGDVGSGKTVIALLALVKTVENGFQGVLLAPTEILAEQHYESFAGQLTQRGVRVGLLVGKLTRKERLQVYEKLAAHEIDIIIGTHALLQEGVKFASLGLVVTDEQHRFGIEQRKKLERQEDTVPDVLVMTATPIPRTMTLTVYGDLDVSVISKLPPGRKPVRTFVRLPEKRSLIYDFVHQEIAAGRQAYVVCPLIEEQEDGKLQSAEQVYQELSKGIFGDVKCGLLHGRMKQAEKDEVMQKFYDNEIQLLVSTIVIEVGVNVPNASVMVIENADRFGLAQLHQLRGRIGRGGYKSYCILISGNRSSNAKQRLKIMETTADGFVLAEKDLQMRGPGQFFGVMQHGMGDLKVADALTDTDILLQARKAAQETLADKSELTEVLQVLRLQYKEQFMQITAN